MPPLHHLPILFKQYFYHSNFYNGSNHLFFFLLSLLPSSSIRQQIAILHSIKPVIQSDTTILSHPSFLHALPKCISTSNTSILSECIDILSIDFSIVNHTSLLYQNIVQKALFSTSTQLQLKCLHWIRQIIQYQFTLSSTSIHFPLLQFIITISLKWFQPQYDNCLTQIAYENIRFLWCSPISSPEMINLQNQFIHMVLTAKESLVPQDHPIETFCMNVFKEETIQNHAKTILGEKISLLKLSTNEEEVHHLQSILFLIECIPTLPHETMNSQLTDIIQQLIETEQTIKKKEMIQITVKTITCLSIQFFEMTNQLDDFEHYLQYHIEIIHSNKYILTNHSLQRSVFIVGLIFRDLTKSIYTTLYTNNSALDITALREIIERLCLESPLSMQSHFLSSYYNCLFHDPTTISSSIMNVTMNVL